MHTQTHHLEEQDAQKQALQLESGGVDPYSILGIHKSPSDQETSIIRLWRPGASVVFIEIENQPIAMERINPRGLFQLKVNSPLAQVRYRVFHTSGLAAEDPYRFLPTLGDIDLFLFNKGVHYELWKCLGAHLTSIDGVQGIRFALWAPNARRVALVADFNHWDGRVNPMRPMGSSGIWELFVPGLQLGEKYKYEIHGQNGSLRIKADPFAFASELRPATASVVCDVERFCWKDQRWVEERVNRQASSAPLLIYEVHLGSWKKKEGSFYNYRQLAIELAAYCKAMHFTHVELLPVMEHPLDESWGYQVSGYFSTTSRYGSPEDFQWFVNHLHEQEIGVILDWVPAHFPTDDFALAQFDGTSLYEHQDPKQGFHPHWATNIFNLGRHEVANFLLASALYWLEVMHVDGLRVDAVASMLYLDYGREEGEWVANQYGGKENLDAIEFLKHLNSIVHSRCPGTLMIAEESTSFTGVTHSLEQGGLGFDLKWNMGWMNDTLRYISKDMFFRCHHQNELTFGQLYAYSERFALVLSHDEVVHGKRSLLSKMPGDRWQKFANLRLLYSYMICQPGKKLIFMGAELGEWDEWSSQRSLCWQLLDYDEHRGIQTMVREVNAVYRDHSALWQRDQDWSGFTWVSFDDTYNSVISYLRHGYGSSLLCVHNFTPNTHEGYRLPLKGAKGLEELFNSDSCRYGGSGKEKGKVHVWHEGAEILLAPLATMIYKVEWGGG